MRWPGIEPGSTAWKAAMLTIIPPTLLVTRIKQIVQLDVGLVQLQMPTHALTFKRFIVFLQ
jgi:hypothetical protein